MTVLVVEDHPLFRDALRQVLQDLDGVTRVVAEGDAEQALKVAETLQDLDLVLLDLGLPGMDGLSAVERFGIVAPGVPVVIISGREDAGEVRLALSLGAVGYIPKSTPPSVMLDALRLVLGGGVYVPPLLARDLNSGSPREPSAAHPVEPGQGLTARQIDVLELLSQGMSNKVIARDLDLSEKTVKTHVTAVFRALGVVNRTQAAIEARRRRVIK